MKISFDSVRPSAWLLAKAAILTAIIIVLNGCSNEPMQPKSSQVIPQNIMQAGTGTSATTTVVPATTAKSIPAEQPIVVTAQDPAPPRPVAISPVPAFGSNEIAVPHYMYPPTGIGAR